MMMPRPSMCHTSALQTPIDKDQALRVSVSGPSLLISPFLPPFPIALQLSLSSSSYLSDPLLQESDLLSLARSLLQAWHDPLLVLSTSSKTLPHPAQSSLSNKIQELQEHSKNLADGLNILSGKVCTCGKETPLKSFCSCTEKMGS